MSVSVYVKIHVYICVCVCLRVCVNICVCKYKNWDTNEYIWKTINWTDKIGKLILLCVSFLYELQVENEIIY